MMIGKNITVTNSNNKSLVGNTGFIIDETKNMIIMRTKKGEKKIIKDQIKFEENA